MSEIQEAPQQVTGLTFADALVRLRNGKHVRRSKWAPTRFVFYQKPRYGNPEHIGERGADGNMREKEWNATSKDLLANDWELRA